MPRTAVRERDDDDIDEVDDTSQSGHAGMGEMAQPTDGRPEPPRQQPREQVPPLEVVEVGEDGQPVDARYREQEAPQDRRLQDERGDETLVERQQREASQRDRPRETRGQRRQREREGRDRTWQENARLREEAAALRTEMDALRQQVGGIEPRLAEFDRGRAQQQISDYDRQITEQQSFAKLARTRIAEAITAGDGAAVSEAMEARDQAIMAAQQLTVRRNMLATGNAFGDTSDHRQAQPRQTQPQPQPAPQPQPMPRVVRERVAEFAESHPWYELVDRRTPDGQVMRVPANLDSKVMWQIDNDVAEAGFDPSTQDYWDEIEDRARQYLPHRFPVQQRQAAQRQANGTGGTDRAPAPRQPEARGPRVSGATDRSPAPRANQVYISPGRKDALMQSGALGRDGRTIENRALYDKYIAGYAKYDRESGAVQ